MNPWIDPLWLSAINGALLHSIWQCAAAAAALWLVLQMAPGSQFRYLASVATLVVAVALFAATYRATLSRGESDQAAYAVPADAVRLKPSGGTGATRGKG